MTTQLIRHVYRHVFHWPSRILSAVGISSPQDSDELLRKHLDDPRFREALVHTVVVNSRGKRVTACFHQLLYKYLRDVRSGTTGVYSEIIKRSLVVRKKEGDFLDPEEFRNKVASYWRHQGTATIQPQSRDETLAFFVIAFGFLQPKDATNFVQVLLPLGSGFAEFFGIRPSLKPASPAEKAVAVLTSSLQAAPSPTAPRPLSPPPSALPSSERAQGAAAPQPPQVPAAPTPQPQLLPSSIPPQAPASPALGMPQPDNTPAHALPLPVEELSPTPERVEAPPSSAVSPQIVAALAASSAAPISLGAPGMLASEGDQAEDEHWQIIDTYASQLFETYQERQKYFEEYERLREQERQQFQADDQAGLTSTQEHIQSLAKKRRAAGERVSRACDGLDQQIARLNEALEKEGAASASTLLGRLRDLTTQARSSPSPEVSEQLKVCASEVRTRLREARALVLRDLEERIEETCERLSALGEPAAETRAFVEAKLYLDWPVERARLRMKNELVELETRIAACAREQASKALEQLDQWLSLSQSLTEQELQVLTRLLEQAAQGNQRPQLPEVGLRLVDRIATAPIPFATALPLWRRAVCCFWPDGTAASRLASVAAALPRPPHSVGPEELVPEVELMLIDAGHPVGDDATEFWPVLETLLERDQPTWAQAFFSALWAEPPPHALARWWLKTQGRGITEARLEELVATLPPVEAYAVRCWAAAHSSGALRPGPHPLLATWLARRQPVPSPETAQRAIDTAGAGREPASRVILGCLVALSGQQMFRLPDIVAGLRNDSLVAIAEHLQVFTRWTREQIAEQLERHRKQTESRQNLDERGDHRNPGGGPATEVWRRGILHKLNALRSRLKQPESREAALRELEALKPERWLKLALEEFKIPGVNPLARTNILQWIADHQRYLPAATEPPVDLPEGFLSPAGSSLQRDLETLSRSDLGQLAARYLSRLREAPLKVLAPEASQDFADEVRALFRELVSKPWLRWRFHLSSGEDWPVLAGEDVLEELAGLCEPQTVARHYLSRRRVELAEALRDQLTGAERSAVDAMVQAANESLREELKAVVQSLVLEQIDQALKAGAQAEVGFSQQLEALHQEATQLLRELPHLPAGQAEHRSNALLSAADSAIKRWEQLDKQRRQEIYDHFLKALQAFRDGRAIEDGPVLAQVLGAALLGDLSEARRYLSLRSLPPDHPSRATLSLHTVPASFRTTRPPRIRPALLVDVAALSRFTRQAWDRVEVPHGFQVPTLHATGLLPVHEQQLSLLRSAKKLYADQRAWRPFLARWALEEGFAQAQDRGFNRASEYARDATLLLAGEPDLEEARWYLDEALTLWLAARLEGSDLARAREPLPWEELRNHLRIAFLVRRFVEYRGLDVLAEIAVEVSGIGGLAPPRLLSTIGENEHHLRGLLVREVIRNGASLDSARVALIADLLVPWLDPGTTARLTELLAQWTDVGTQGTSAEWLRQLSQLQADAGIPPELRARIEESFQQRNSSYRAQPSDTRFSCVLATTFVYLSSAKESKEGIQLVANVTYREGQGNVLDLKLAATLEHPTLTLESANKIQEVGLLRAGDVKDIVFPLVTAPGSERGGEAAKAQVTLLLYREDARGQTEQLSRRKFQVNVAANYPHQDEPTPYITGKCVSERSMIKGRDKEVAEILGKLRGQHGENFVLIYGMRRIGKSSLLQRLSLDNRFRKHYEMVHLDLERHLKETDTHVTLLAKFADHIREELVSPRARALEPHIADAPDCYAAFERYLRRIAEVLGDNKRLLLLFDEFQMLFAAKEKQPGFADLVKTLRHWIQFLPVGFVVAGTPELKKATLGPEQRLFQLGLPVELKALDEQAARELIQEPVAKYFHVTGPATNLIIEETDRLPNLIQIVCHHLFLRMLQRQQTVATQRDVREVVKAVSRNGEHFSFLLSPVGNDPLRRAVIRALAELGVDEKRGTVDELLEHLHSHGYDQAVTQEALEQTLKWLGEHELTFNWKGELRLRPALLARHVLQRQEYEL